MEKILTYSLLALLLFAVLKILNYYMLVRMAKEKAKAVYNKKESEKIKARNEKQQQELNDLLDYKDNIGKYYLVARDNFNTLMKHGTLKREQIIYLKKLIDDSLGDYKNYYNGQRYKNDAHEIYCKLKSTHINENDYKKIVEYLELFI